MKKFTGKINTTKNGATETRDFTSRNQMFSVWENLARSCNEISVDSETHYDLIEFRPHQGDVCIATMYQALNN